MIHQKPQAVMIALMCTVIPINAFEDNYIWLIRQGQQVIVVDPGDATPVIDYLAAHQLTLAAVLITHHHNDHIGGVKALLQYQDAPVYAPSYGNYPFEHQAVSHQDKLTFAAFNHPFEALWLPGHTHDHIVYRFDNHLFCGDVIFGAGCGRIFNGTLAQQYSSLNFIANLPEETRLYCAHEYTLTNIAFALTIEPDNSALIKRQTEELKKRKANQPTIPLLLKTELATNPFLRCQLLSKTQASGMDGFAFFSKIRELRNHY